MSYPSKKMLSVSNSGRPSGCDAGSTIGQEEERRAQVSHRHRQFFYELGALFEGRVFDFHFKTLAQARRMVITATKWMWAYLVVSRVEAPAGGGQQVDCCEPVVHDLAEQRPLRVPAVEQRQPVHSLAAARDAAHLCEPRSKPDGVVGQHREPGLGEGEVDRGLGDRLDVGLGEASIVRQRVHEHHHWQRAGCVGEMVHGPGDVPEEEEGGGGSSYQIGL